MDQEELYRLVDVGPLVVRNYPKMAEQLVSVLGLFSEKQI